jgi:hypothetical protein
MAVRATGTVSRLYVRAEALNIRLAVAPSLQPKDEYFTLAVEHPNYYSLLSLAMSAAVNRLPLQIRTQAEISATEAALVEYMVVDW